MNTRCPQSDRNEAGERVTPSLAGLCGSWHDAGIEWRCGLRLNALTKKKADGTAASREMVSRHVTE